MYKRNASVDIQKFFYSWIIVLLHFYIQTREHFKGGGNAVEFFLLVSGVFFFLSWENKKNELKNDEKRVWYPSTFIRNRFLKFFPYTSWAFVASFFVTRVLKNFFQGELTLNRLADFISKDIWEFFLISMNGMNRGGGLLNGPVWTLSAMLIVEFLILTLLVWNEKFYLTVIAPVSILVGYGFWANLENTDHMLWYTVLTFGIVRVFIVTSLSYYVCRMIAKLSTINFNRKGEVFLAIMEVSLHILAILTMIYKNNRYYRWGCTLLFMVAIAISISGKSALGKKIKVSKITNWLGKWSMSIYLIHMPVRNLFMLRYDDPYALYSHLPAYILAVVVASIALLYVAEWSVLAVRRLWAHLQKTLVLENSDSSEHLQ